MSYRYRAQRRRRPPQPSCLGLLLRFSVALILIAALYVVLVRPRVSEFIGQEVARQVSAPPQLGAEARLALPMIVAALPNGEVVVTENQANTYLAANAEAIAPIDSANVRFVPGQIQIDLRAFGTDNRARAGLVAQNGQVAVVNPELDGPLGLALSIEDLLRTLEQQFNAELLAQNQTISDLRIEQGQVVMTVN